MGQSATDRKQPAETAAKFPAARKPLAVVLFVLVAGLGLAADLVTKGLAFDTLLSEPQAQRRLEQVRATQPNASNDDVLRLARIERYAGWGLTIHLSTNPGIAFGMSMNRLLVGLFTVVTIGLIAYFFATSPARAWSVHVGLGLTLAGAVGNLVDRFLGVVALPGVGDIRYQVRDFIDFSSVEVELLGSKLNYPFIFNVADILLVVGPALLVLHWIVSARRAKNKHSSGN